MMSKKERTAQDKHSRTKLEKYIETEKYRDDRKREYPNMGDQLDAIWKQINQDRLGGKKLIQEADDFLNEILAVKAKYPKPKLKKVKGK